MQDTKVCKWYSAKDANLTNNGQSRFVDSKFALDKKTSVVRELIQNSIDAKVGKCVDINLDIVGINREKIPGIEELIRRINLCKQYANVDAMREYDSAIKLLNKSIVYCLKVSDRNTTGVNADIDEKGNSQYRALVYDEGNSYGKGQGTAGSHGVGKRASFILSECNTVFYATKYKSKTGKDICLTEGKYMLSTWYDNDEKMCGDGWFGIVHNNDVKPIENAADYEIDDFFIRTDEYGTDVIAIAIDYENKEAQFKELYINSVLENFYVGIIDKKIRITVFGEMIDDSTIDEVYDKYYVKNKAAYLAGTNKCLLIGNLYDTKRIYKDNKPFVYEIVVSGEKLGDIEIYYDNDNIKNKKYYSVIRSHGMKIRDYKLDTEKEFTAVVKINGKALNESLLKLENAAHDDFLSKNPESGVEYDAIATAALSEIKSVVENFIKEKTKIESADIQKIEGLNSILSLPGKVSTAKLVDREIIPKPPTLPRPPMPPKEKNKTLFSEYSRTPRFIENDGELVVVFDCARDVKAGVIRFSAVDFEGKEVNGMQRYYGTIIAMLDNNFMKTNKNDMYDVTGLSKGRHKISFKISGLLPYKYAIDIFENC